MKLPKIIQTLFESTPIWNTPAPVVRLIDSKHASSSNQERGQDSLIIGVSNIHEYDIDGMKVKLPTDPEGITLALKLYKLTKGTSIIVHIQCMSPLASPSGRLPVLLRCDENKIVEFTNLVDIVKKVKDSNAEISSKSFLVEALIEDLSNIWKLYVIVEDSHLISGNVLSDTSCPISRDDIILLFLSDSTLSTKLAISNKPPRNSLSKMITHNLKAEQSWMRQLDVVRSLYRIELQKLEGRLSFISAMLQDPEKSEAMKDVERFLVSMALVIDTFAAQNSELGACLTSKLPALLPAWKSHFNVV